MIWAFFSNPSKIHPSLLAIFFSLALFSFFSLSFGFILGLFVSLMLHSCWFSFRTLLFFFDSSYIHSFIVVYTEIILISNAFVLSSSSSSILFLLCSWIGLFISSLIRYNPNVVEEKKQQFSSLFFFLYSQITFH